MRSSSVPATRVPVVETLALAIAVLAAIAALAGLFWPGGDGAYTVTSWRGQEVEVFGRGLYRDSSTFNGAGARGTDIVTLLVVVPMLLLATAMHRRGSIRGTLLLAGALTWVFYVYASVSLGTVAYTSLFLLHVALFGASLWALVYLILGVDLRALGANLQGGIPRRGLAIFLFASGIITALIWLLEPVAALVANELPESLGLSTSLITYAFDLAVIFPAAIITGLLVRAGRPAGYLFAMPILILEALLAPMIVAQTIFQLDAGVEFSGVQMVVMIGGFFALAVVAIWMIAAVFRHIHDDVPWPAPLGRHERLLAR
jgi:hypothetical protein